MSQHRVARSWRSSPLWLAGLALFLLSFAGCDMMRARDHMSEGNRLYRAQKWVEAIREYEKAAEIDEEAWEPHYRIATSYLSMYQPGSADPKQVAYATAARKSLERCLELEPPDEASQEKVHEYLVGLLAGSGDWETAITHLEKRLADNPNDLALVQQLGALYAKRGDFPNAMRFFERRAELEPDNAEAWYMIGVTCWERSNKGGEAVTLAEREQLVAKGLAALERALQIKPDYFESLAYLNLLHRERAGLLRAAGKIAEADADMARANELQQQAMALRNAAPSAKN